MNRDQALGMVILLASVAGIMVYGWLVFLSQWSVFVIQLTAFVAVGGILAILAWIGYTLATTPPPQPIEDLEKTEIAEGDKGQPSSQEGEKKG